MEFEKLRFLSQDEAEKFILISDRWGDPQDGAYSIVPDLDTESEFYKSLLAMMRDELSFICKHGDTWGVLFNEEFVHLDSDDRSEVENSWGPDFDATPENVIDNISRRYSFVPAVCPNIKAFVTEGNHTFHGRVELYAFAPLGTSAHELILASKAILDPNDPEVISSIERAVLKKCSEHKQPTPGLGL